jgi:hypothetical protein
MQVETLLDLNSYLESQQQQQHHHYHQEEEPKDEEMEPSRKNAPKRRN